MCTEDVKELERGLDKEEKKNNSFILRVHCKNLHLICLFVRLFC